VCSSDLRTSASKSQAINALRESERAISDSNRKLAKLSSQRHTADKTLANLRAKQRNLGVTLQQQQRLLGKQLYLQYIGGSTGYLQQLLSGTEPNQLARNLRYYQYLARERASWLTGLRSNLGALKSTSLETQQQSSNLAALTREEITQRNELKQSKQQHQQMLKKFSRQLRQQKRDVHRLQRDEAQLAQLIEKLSRLVAQPKSSDNSDLPDAYSDGHPFEQLKGKLNTPVKGKISGHFGALRPDGVARWKGLFIKAATGQTVKAVAAGRVVFADWLRGFGNLLIIDHGMGYMSLYGNNETLLKQVGDLTDSNEPVAAVGNSGGNEQSGLYFELRHESRPFDPTHWLVAK
jgi:septal ring factor EnvC (AmiA/AmiB activator)